MPADIQQCDQLTHALESSAAWSIRILTSQCQVFRIGHFGVGQAEPGHQ